jgi:hypothetical protein
MPRYRFDFLLPTGDLLATHEIDYANDQAAVAGGHLINGCPTIGHCFQVWRDSALIHWHYNVPATPQPDETSEGSKRALG